jgi:hypothetical protein
VETLDNMLSQLGELKRTYDVALDLCFHIQSALLTQDLEALDRLTQEMDGLVREISCIEDARFRSQMELAEALLVPVHNASLKHIASALKSQGRATEADDLVKAGELLAEKLSAIKEVQAKNTSIVKRRQAYVSFLMRATSRGTPYREDGTVKMTRPSLVSRQA